MFMEIPPSMRERMQYLERVDAEQRQQGLPPPQRYCQVPPETGRFLALLASMSPHGACIEIGTSAGYSTMWLNMARRNRGCSLQTFENAEWKIALARETFRLTGIADEVELISGDAREHLRQRQGRDVAFCFLDAAIPDYATYYEAVLPLLVPHGVLAADNVESHREQLAPFVEQVTQDPRVDAVVVPIGKGVLLARKKGGRL